MAEKTQLDPKEVGRLLVECKSETLEQLQAFASFVVNETHERTALVDQKGAAMLGWSAASLVFLLYTVTGNAENVQPAVVLLTRIGAGLAGLAAISSFIALRVRAWNVPSEEDWFQEAYFTEPKKLQAFHLQELLRFQQNARGINDRKSFWGSLGQWALMLASLLAAAAVLMALGF